MTADDGVGQREHGAGLARSELGGWQVDQRDDAAEVLRHVDVFVGSLGSVDELPPDEQILQWIPEPRHGKVRRVINGVIALHRLKGVEPFLRQLARDLLGSALAQPGPVDLVPVYVDPIPTRTLAHLFGVPAADAELFRRLTDEFLSRQQTLASGKSVGQVHPELAAYVDGLIAARRTMERPPDDLIGRFIEADVGGEALTDAAIRTQMIMLIIAGNETTRNLLGNIVATLATTPGLFDRLRSDPSLVDAVVEESLRHDAPVQMLFRTCAHDTSIGATAVQGGDPVVVCLGAANHDEAHYVEPEAFDIDRDGARDHLAFGIGPHVCPGASLARLEGRIATEELVAAVAEIRLAPGAEITWNPVFWARGVRSLPVELVPASPAPSSRPGPQGADPTS